MTTTTPPISRFPVPELADIPEDIRARIREVQEKSGFVPNVFLALSHRPDECRAFFAYHDALMLREGSSLTKGERKMIVVATSAANQCLYCVVAHGAILRIAIEDALVQRRLAAEGGVEAGRVDAQGLGQVGDAHGVVAFGVEEPLGGRHGLVCIETARPPTPARAARHARRGHPSRAGSTG